MSNALACFLAASAHIPQAGSSAAPRCKFLWPFNEGRQQTSPELLALCSTVQLRRLPSVTRTVQKRQSQGALSSFMDL